MTTATDSPGSRQERASTDWLNTVLETAELRCNGAPINKLGANLATQARSVNWWVYRMDSLRVSVLAFGALCILAGYTFFDATYLTSTCFDEMGQTVCPAKGPDWARPLPALTAVLSIIVGLVGLFIGRQVRTVALIAGFLLTSAGLIVSKVMSSGVASTFL